MYTWKSTEPSCPADRHDFDLSKAGPATHGDTVSVEVVARDPSGGQSPTASAQVVVDDTAPTTGAVTITPSSPKAGQTLTAAPTAFADADGDTLTYQYTWKINGTVVPGETGPTLDLSKAGHAIDGETVSVEVVARDPSGGRSPAASAQVVVDNTAPTSGAVTITPSSPKADQTLTATPTAFADADGDTLTYQYTWMINGTVVPGETGPTLDLSKAGHATHGDMVSVEVVARDPSGGQSPAASAQVVVDNTAPTSGAVTITPSSPTAHQTLTAAPTEFADADGDPLTYQYTWFHNGQPITGATTATLPGSAVVAGETVSVQVVASDGHGAQSSAATSAVNVSASSGGGTGALNVTVASPTARYYRLGSTLLVTYACSASSGVANCTATLGPAGGKASTVTSGTRIRLSKTGRYVLRISAGDTHGNAMTKTVTFRVTADRTRPSITVLSPSGRTYRLRQMLLVKFSATDPVGVASTSATLGPVGGKASKVTSGKKVQLSIRGRYVLRITAKDNVGNSSVKTVYFRVK